MNRIAAVMLCFSLLATGCDSITMSAEEKLCHADITSKLLNPETAEIRDFKVIMLEGYLAIMLSDAQARNEERLSHNKINKIVSWRYASVRVRAEGRLGNTITEEQGCVITAMSCTCMSPFSI